MNKNIIKEYDIRGKYPKEINEDACFEIGRMWGRFLKQQEKKDSKTIFLKNRKKIALARDMRKSSPQLARALSAGIMSEGIDIDYLGMASTPMLYWTVANKEYLGGAIITASHNSSECNGIKLCGPLAYPISPREVLDAPLSLPKADRLVSGNPPIRPASPKLQRGEDGMMIKGVLQKKSYCQEYFDFIKAYYQPGSLRRLKIAVDAAWAMASDEIPFILNELNIDFIPVCFGPSENFSNKDINPLNQGALDDLARTVRKYKADIGIAFDGDADRVVFTDEKGEMIDPEIITVLIANKINTPLHERNLAKQGERAGDPPASLCARLPARNASRIDADGQRCSNCGQVAFRAGGQGGRLILDSRAGRQSRDPLEKMGFEVIASRSGSTNIKKSMIENKAAFGAETSGHYFFNIAKSGNYAPADNAMIAMMKILSLLSLSPKAISKIAEKYNKFFKSRELNFEVKNPAKIISNIKKQFISKISEIGGPAISHLDGLAMEFSSPEIWRFSLRPSNTEPNILRLNVEAEKEDLLREKIKELKKRISG